MRLGLLSSWPWDIARGSGTARFLVDLERALVAEGVGVVRIDADLDPADYASFVARRLEWNRTLAGDLRVAGIDAVLALDYDGVDLPPPPAGPIKVVCPQAVFADLAETEPEPFRSHLLLQAEAERRNVHSAAALVVPSRYAADGVARAYGVARDRLVVIPHGFDHEEWATLLSSARGRAAAGFPDASGRRDRSLQTVLAVAKLYPRKGIDLLLEASALLRSSLPGMRVRIVGGGIERERLERIACDLGVTDIVRFEGDVEDRRRMAAFYAEANLFCLPSLHETFGFVFVEAMTAGLPIVALNAGAAPEVIGDAGWLVPPGDARVLAGAIGEILSDPRTARTLGERGRARAARFNWRDAAMRYLEVVRSVIGPAPAGITL
jgi:glycosyltransferase involved in cell wall biosynthesis